MTEKRFINDIDNGQLIDAKGELSTIDYSDKVDFYELWEFLNKLADENEKLKQSVNNLKDTIIKITIAYQRKYDRTIVDLVDEVHEEDITDLIKELKE